MSERTGGRPGDGDPPTAGSGTRAGDGDGGGTGGPGAAPRDPAPLRIHDGVSELIGDPVDGVLPGPPADPGRGPFGDPLRDPLHDPARDPLRDPSGGPFRAPAPGTPYGAAGAGRTADRISVTGLRARGRHGVLAAERELGQEFVVDVTLFLDTAPAAAGDDLSLTVHYGELAEDLVRVVEGEPVDLIETLAQRLADVCLAREPVLAAEVSVHKPSAPIPLPFDDVIVTITRSRA